MADQSAIIFGASGGIGSRLARSLSEKGWALTLCARDEERLGTLSKELDALAFPMDATQPEQVTAAVEEAVATHGRITAAVNAVGSILIKPAHLTTDEEFVETLRLNLFTAFYVVRAAARAMRREGGSIALVSSAAAQTGVPNHEAIAAAKGGIISLTRSAAATYAKSKIRVNAVAPGLVATELASRITKSEASLKASLAMHPLGRIGEPEDIASALEWLIEPGNNWVTGQILGVDGGLGALKAPA